MGGDYPGFYGGGFYPYYGSDYGPRYYDPRYRCRYRYASRYPAGRVSCRHAIQIVRQSGFRNVRARDCRGRQYRFTGKKRGRWYSMKMRSRNGRIYGVRRI